MKRYCLSRSRVNKHWEKLRVRQNVALLMQVVEFMYISVLQWMFVLGWRKRNSWIPPLFLQKNVLFISFLPIKYYFINPLLYIKVFKIRFYKIFNIFSDHFWNYFSEYHNILYSVKTKLKSYNKCLNL